MKQYLVLVVGAGMPFVIEADYMSVGITTLEFSVNSGMTTRPKIAFNLQHVVYWTEVPEGERIQTDAPQSPEIKAEGNVSPIRKH